MRWQGREESSNVEDRRGMRVPGGGRGLGIGGAILLLAFVLITGKDPRALLQLISQVQDAVPESSAPPAGAPTDELGQFASVVLKDTESTWGAIFSSGGGGGYQAPTMVLFSQAVRSACGTASSAVGPFYCPSDRKVYLDLSFFDELSHRFGAPGDFAQAYVIAHEVGHHVQNLLGISDQIHSAQQRARGESEVNALSVRLELQADCLAGVWANHTKIELEAGDVEEGLRAAAAIGDDRLQKLGQDEVQPESWTHGSSEQRVHWLRQGLKSGDPNSCKT